jgi:hypothetical protein
LQKLEKAIAVSPRLIIDKFCLLMDRLAVDLELQNTAVERDGIFGTEIAWERMWYVGTMDILKGG